MSALIAFKFGAKQLHPVGGCLNFEYLIKRLLSSMTGSNGIQAAM